MACLNQQGLCTTMGPRISFSNDFADNQQTLRHEQYGYKEAPVSSDFEFSVSGYKMIPADEVFFKGKLLPLRENSNKATTLKDELLSNDDNDYDDIFPSVGKGSWKERFGFKRAPSLPKKVDNKETKMPDFFNDIITGAN